MFYEFGNFKNFIISAVSTVSGPSLVMNPSSIRYYSVYNFFV